MNKGTKILYSSTGFTREGQPLRAEFSEELIFDQFTADGKLICVTKDGFIRVVMPDTCCKIIDMAEYMMSNDPPLTYLPEPPGYRKEEKPPLFS